jgi:serine/threonine protein kinase
MAPEVISAPQGSKGYDYRADIWSLGITALEMAEGKPPHYDLQPLRVIFIIPQKPAPSLSKPDEWSSGFNDFLSKCLQKDPENRAFAKDLLKHSWIKKHSKRANKEIEKLVSESIPYIVQARKEAMENDANGGSSYAPGSILKVNTNTKTASVIDTGSVVIQGNSDTGGSVIISHFRELESKYGSVIIQ